MFPLFSIQHSNIFIKLDQLENASYKLVCITPHQQEELADILVSKVCTKETGVKVIIFLITSIDF